MPSVGILRYSKNPVDARDNNIQERAKSHSLAGALPPLRLDVGTFARMLVGMPFNIADEDPL